jgi:hypothetical protein
MSEENKALALRSWQLLDNPDILEKVYALISCGTNPIKKSGATRKPGSSSLCTRPPSPT